MGTRSSKKKFSKFYDKYIDKIFRFVFLKVHSVEVSQDITSDAFLRFWKQLNSGTKIKNQKAFIYQVARNLVIDYYRKPRIKTLDLDKVQIQDITANLEDQAVFGQEVNEVINALTKISEDYQEVLVFYYLEEFSVPEISGILNKSESAVRVSIHRAIDSLRSRIHTD